MSAVEIALPAELWKDVEAGTEALLERWLVGPGARVAAGQPVAEVVLVKATVEVLAPAAGVVGPLLVQAKETFAQGRALATIQTGP